MSSELHWAIPSLPAVSFLAITSLLNRRRNLAAYASILATAVSMLISAYILFGGELTDFKAMESNLRWLQFGEFHLDVGLLIDPLSAVMCVVVTAISLLVQIYSVGYMKGDDGYARFFAYLSLFTAAMLGLVVSNNLFQMYIFWELVGLCSYLLIGFWHHKPAAAAASTKAFLINRLGDLGLLLGILIFSFATARNWGEGAFLGFRELPQVLTYVTQNNILPEVGLVSITTVGLLILMGAMAKSAQFPLHIWLPDAMEGPTPISALIHAATMVAAGVFLLARVHPMIEASTITMYAVASIGAFTALFAATIALTQHDIKKALAYSTCSQLGYMIMAVGLGAWIPAMFHLITHACFKANLFLGSGAVIHGCHHEQDMRRFGGLRKKMPITAAAFLIGTLAISGFPGLAGFWSKEQIIAASWTWGEFNIFYVASILTAGLTAFYMLRIYLLTFEGKYRGSESPHEVSISMWLPLVLLSIPSILLGLIGTPVSSLGGDNFARFLGSAQNVHSVSAAEFFLEFFKPQILLPLASSLIGSLLAVLTYGVRVLPVNEYFRSLPIYQLCKEKWFIDEGYSFVVNKIFLPLFEFKWKFIDCKLTDGLLVGGLARLSAWTGKTFATVQSGRVQTYIGLVCIGFLIAIITYFGFGIEFDETLHKLIHGLKAD